jgi:predicted DNA-binding protein
MRYKAMSLRLPVELAANFEAVARTDGVTLSEAARDAIAKHIEDRRADPVFQQRLKEEMERNQAALRRLLDQ